MMRDYSTISPRFWIGHTGKKIKAMGADATIVALYLMTSPHANMLGLYYLPKYYLSHETGLTLEGASKGLQCCIEADFCTYDEASEVVWIFEMARLQLGEQLKPTDKRVIGIQNIYDKLPENPFLPTFYDKYLGLFSMQRKRDVHPILAVPLEAPSKPLRSQEQEQDKEQEQETDTSPSLRSGEPRAKKKIKTQIAEDAQPTEKDQAVAEREAMTAATFRVEWQKYRAHHLAHGSVFSNWHQAWVKWVSIWISGGRRQSDVLARAGPRSVGSGFSDMLDELRERENGNGTSDISDIRTTQRGPAVEAAAGDLHEPARGERIAYLDFRPQRANTC